MSAAKEDVEMKEAVKEEVKKVEEPVDPFFGMHFQIYHFLEFKKTMVLMEKAGKEKDYKLSGSLTK